MENPSFETELNSEKKTKLPGSVSSIEIEVDLKKI